MGKESRKDILSGATSLRVARVRINAIDSEVGYNDRADFCADLAALVAYFPRRADQKTFSGRRVSDHLHQVCAPGNTEWLINNERIRRGISERGKRHLCVGTTGVEALNAELKHWFNGIVQMHVSILRLKIRIFVIQNLLTVCSALSDPTTVQMTKSYLLGRILQSWVPINDGWVQFCQNQKRVYWSAETRTLVRPAKPDLMLRMASGALTLRNWAQLQKKKPKRKRPLKRTPFTQDKGLIKIRKNGNVRKPQGSATRKHIPVLKAAGKCGLRRKN